MITPITVHKTLKKTLNIAGKNFTLIVKYSNHERAPYDVELDGINITFSRRRWSTNLHDIPLMIIELKAEAEEYINGKNTIEDNIKQINKYFDEF